MNTNTTIPNNSETTMKNKSITNDKVRQGTTVYHVDYGKGHVIALKPRRDNDLCFCWFPKAKTHDWIGVRSLVSGTGEITLTPHPAMSAAPQSDDPLQAALENLFGGKPPRGM
jgi:hypothetical protein